MISRIDLLPNLDWTPAVPDLSLFGTALSNSNRQYNIQFSQRGLYWCICQMQCQMQFELPCVVCEFGSLWFPTIDHELGMLLFALGCQFGIHGVFLYRA